MITHKARLIATLAAAIALQGAAQAQPQLSGTPGELRGFLFPRPHTVNISGDGEITTYKDQAKVSLMVTTEALDLYQSMKANQELRNKLTQDFISAGIPAGDINNSKFSSSPQFGFFGRDPSSYEVTARSRSRLNLKSICSFSRRLRMKTMRSNSKAPSSSIAQKRRSKFKCAS